MHVALTKYLSPDSVSTTAEVLAPPPPADPPPRVGSKVTLRPKASEAAADMLSI